MGLFIRSILTCLLIWASAAHAQNYVGATPKGDKCPLRFPKDEKWGAAFQDALSGQCWSCPKDMGRTVLTTVYGSSACSSVIPPKSSKALFRGMNGGPINNAYAKIEKADVGERFSFYVATDTQIGMGDLSSFAITQHVIEMNKFADRMKRTWPEDYLDMSGETVPGGGTFVEPRAVVTTGDLTQDGVDYELTYFRWLYEDGLRDYFENNATLASHRDHVIKYPVLVGLGNHDSDAFCAANGCAVEMFQYVKNRHKRCYDDDDCAIDEYHNPDKSLEESSQSYAWTWGGVKFIQLHQSAYSDRFGRKEKGKSDFYEHTTAEKWLRGYLEGIGEGTPVVIFQHWPPTRKPISGVHNRDGLGDMLIDTGVNVLAIFAGHTHKASQGKWTYSHSDGGGRQIIVPYFVGGSGGVDLAGKSQGQFYIVEINTSGSEGQRWLKTALATWTQIPKQTLGSDPSPAHATYSDTKTFNRVIKW